MTTTADGSSWVISHFVPRTNVLGMCFFPVRIQDPELKGSLWIPELHSSTLQDFQPLSTTNRELEKLYLSPDPEFRCGGMVSKISIFLKGLQTK